MSGVCPSRSDQCYHALVIDSPSKVMELSVYLHENLVQGAAPMARLFAFEPTLVP